VVENLSKLSFLVSPFVLWSALFLFSGITIIISWIFIYHWKKFGFQNQMILKAEIIYLIVTGLLLIASILTAIGFLYL
jgi:hypothetical protein